MAFYNENIGVSLFQQTRRLAKKDTSGALSRVFLSESHIGIIELPPIRSMP